MTQEKSYAHSTQWGMEQTQGVPAGWSVMRSGEWISFQRPDGWTQSVTPNEPQYSRGETLFMLLDAMLSAAPQAQPVEAEQAAAPAPEVAYFDGCLMVGYSKDRDDYCVYEETAPGEYCAIKGPFKTKEEADSALRDPNAPTIFQASPAQAQPVEAEQATSETPEKTPTGYSRPPNGEPAHPEDWNAGYEAGLADGHEIGADAGRLPVAWMYEHDGCNDEPILTAVRWPECREPWNETPLDALALAKHAIEKVWLDAVGTGNGEHSISEAARARVEFAADALKLGLRLPDALRKTGVESPLPKPAQPVEAEQAATGAHGTFPAPDLRGIDGATHSEWRFLRVPANEMLIQEKDLPEIIKRACLAYVSQPAQPVREPMSVDAIRDAIDDAGMDWHNGWTVGEDSENRYLNLCRAIERHHGIDAARANR